MVSDPEIASLIGDLRSGALRIDPEAYASKRQNAVARVMQQADARSVSFTPITVEERFRGFKLLNFRPGGLYIPDDKRMADDLRSQLNAIRVIPEKFEREEAYFALQASTGLWEEAGYEGHWTYQMAIAKSSSRFRIAAFGRRAGKTYLAAREALAVAKMRPRSWIWCAGKTADACDRAFQMIVGMLRDSGEYDRLTTARNQKHEKLLVLPNGSRIEGMSLNGEVGAAGTAIDYVILDEAEFASADDWQEQIEPVLTDRAGHAFLISSTQKDESWFWEFVEAAREDRAAGLESEWEGFTGSAWDNFFSHPEGRNSKTLRTASRRMDPERFMAIYGGVPSAGRGRIFPAFVRSVHVDERAEYMPGTEVILVVDPSAGRNQYAVSAWHDLGDMSYCFDEYYETGKIAEEVGASIRRRPWADDVSEVYVDPGWMSEVTRWQQMGFNAYPVVNEDAEGNPTNRKPDIKETIPFVNLMLRDPGRFERMEQDVAQQVLDEWGWERKAVTGKNRQMEMQYFNEQGQALDSKDKKLLLIEVTERLSPSNLTPEQLNELRECARVFWNPRCEHFISEMEHYRWKKVRGAETEEKEEPRKKENHLVDTARYYAWTKKRHFFGPEFAPGGGMMDSGGDPYGDREYAGNNWIQAMRLAARRH